MSRIDRNSPKSSVSQQQPVAKADKKGVLTARAPVAKMDSVERTNGARAVSVNASEAQPGPVETHAAVGAGLVSLMNKGFDAGERLPHSDLVVMRTRGNPFNGVATGTLKRGTNKKGEVEALFVPDERSMKPFVLSPYDAQGIASGGRVTIVGGIHGLALDTKATESVTSMVGRVEKDGGGYVVTGLDKFAPMLRVPLEGATEADVGKTALAHIVDPFSQSRRAQLRETFDSQDVWAIKWTDVATRNGVEATFSDKYLKELADLKAKFNPNKIEGYVDMTDKPFITVDNPYSKDYDQAMYIEDSPTIKGAHDVYYAIADTSYFMKLLPKGSEIAERSKRMQTTTYMPGIDMPILHRDLSEGLVSLNPNQNRPTLMCKYTVGADGKVIGEPVFSDAVIRSRVATNYPAAQAYIDGKAPNTDPMLAKAFEQLKVTGGALLEQAIGRKMLQSTAGERWATIDPKTKDLVLEKRGALWIESANAQISITENALAGEYIIKNEAPAYHRIHGEPDKMRIELARNAVKELGVDWPEGMLPSEMLNHLDPKMPGFMAIRILVLRAQPRAVVSGQPAAHDGLKLTSYDQMTAPMRRDRDGRNHQFVRDIRDRKDFDISDVEDVLRYAEMAQDRDRRIDRVVEDSISAKALEPFAGKVLKAEVIALSQRGIEVYIPEVDIKRFIPMQGPNELEAFGTVLNVKGDHPMRLRLTETIEIRVDQVTALEGKARVTPLTAPTVERAQAIRSSQGSSFEQVRGTGFRSPLVGKDVTTEGVVSAINEVGFYLEAEGGGSGGMLVRTRGARVAIGDRVRVSGKVRELADKGNQYGRTVVEITDRPSVERLGQGKLAPPVDLTQLGAPPSDYVGATDYWRKLLGARVTIGQSTTLTSMNRFGDLVVLPEGWKIPEDRVSQYGGVLYKEGLENTIRAGVKYRNHVGTPPSLSMGAKLADIEGIVTYRSGDFQIELSDTPKVVSNPKIESEKTTLKRSATAFTFCSLNMLNANPDEVERLRAGAQRIVHEMDSPDVLLPQEIQDDDGPKVSDVVSAAKTYETIVKLIREAGGPEYAYIDLPPRNGEDGGQPGGNIRNGFLYRKDRIKLIDGSVQRVGENSEAFKGSRKSVVAGFRFNGKDFYFMNTHHKSMLGSSPWTGEQQPPIIGGEEQRLEQSKLERDWIDGFRKRTPSFWVTMGDRNATPGASSVTELTKTGFVNMSMTVPAEKRFDYNYRGNLQSLCSVVVSPELAQNDRMKIEYLHGNSVNPIEDSDHDHVIGLVETANI